MHSFSGNWIRLAVVVLASSFGSFLTARAGTVVLDQDILFDSFTPPSTIGGFSSADGGAAMQISVGADLRIGEISFLNEMLASGNLRFAILSFPDPEFLLLTDPVSFNQDLPGMVTWKPSGQIDFLLEAGNQYLIGYLRDVPVNSVGDAIAETQSGVSSDLYIHVMSDFDNPRYENPFWNGAENAFRLHAIPEPAVPALVLLALPPLLLTRRRRKSRCA